MPGFFEARDNFKPTPKQDNFYIVVEDKNIVALTRSPNENTVKVSEQDYKFLLDNGIDYYIYNGKIEKKPPKKVERLFSVLSQGKDGYALHKNDPFWPVEKQEQGVVWQTLSE
jgi:hypothetical protein